MNQGVERASHLGNESARHSSLSGFLLNTPTALGMNWQSIISSHQPPALLETLVAFERELEVILPSAYREFLLTCNGGQIVVEHTLETRIDGYIEQTGVSSLYPLSLPNSALSLGVKEYRHRWHASKVGIETALAIGDDGGTGFFFIMLSQRFFGQIYFAYKDEFQSNSPDWQAGTEAMPDYMGLISRNFSELGELIEHRANSSI